MLSHFDTILQHDRRIDGRTEFRYQYWQTDREESCNKLHGDDMTECCGKRSLCVVYWHRNINTSSSAFNHIHRLCYQLSVLDTHTHTHQSHHTSLLVLHHFLHSQQWRYTSGQMPKTHHSSEYFLTVSMSSHYWATSRWDTTTTASRRIKIILRQHVCTGTELTTSENK